MNTTKKGSIRCIIFREHDTWYGVALEFNLVISADDFDIARFELDEAIRGYVESMKKLKGTRVSPLNQTPMAEYANLWKKLVNNRPIPSPYKVKHFGVTTV
ncbi:MAG: hypothetical protein KBC33_03035 [Candidatus Pacebacteria bacterium]|nr:hypothetical protein [Candidatus Paceibacterota bacterium]